MTMYALIVGIVLVAEVGTNETHSTPTELSVAPLGGLPTASEQSPGQPAADSVPAANPFSTPPAGSKPMNSFQSLGFGPPGEFIPSGGGTLPTDSSASVSTQEPSQQVSDSAGAKPNPLAEPAALMRSILTAPRDSRLTGQAIGLEDVVAGASSRTEQTALVNAYWDLCSSVADYYLTLEQQAELRRLRSLVTNMGPPWQQAEADLAVGIATAQRAAAASQHRLASLMGRGETEPLPLPADVPHCGDYRARYEQIFTSRSSSEAAELNELLPLLHAELADAAGAVARAEEWLDTAAARPNDSAGDGRMLSTIELLALRRHAFVQIACDYNRRIVRYTELAAPGQITPDVLVGMLIKTDRRRVSEARQQSPPGGTGGSARQTGGVVGSTSATPSRPTGGVAPTTGGGDWAPVGFRASAQPSGSSQPRSGQAVTPTSAESTPKEHSLLVPPRRRR
jgi:hypothetical protein